MDDPTPNVGRRVTCTACGELVEFKLRPDGSVCVGCVCTEIESLLERGVDSGLAGFPDSWHHLGDPDVRREE
jgi:hypothetical protein